MSVLSRLRPGEGRVAVLRDRGFRRYFAGYATSMLGTNMSTVATAFAVLQSGVGPAGLGYVLAARILPQVVLVLGGGVVADRIGRRQVMLGADVLRFVTQAGFAAIILVGAAPLWLLIIPAVLLGVGEAFFNPALSALTSQIAPAEQLTDANALLGLAQSTARIAGPAIAGLLVAVTSPAIVIAVDAATYGVSVLCLALINVPPLPGTPRRNLIADLREGWSEFSSHTWLWVTTLQFSLFNLIVWGPFLALGPVAADQRLDGARSWGLIMAGYGGGAVFGGLAMLGRRPRRPLLVAVGASLGWAAPSAFLAAGLPTLGVFVGTVLAGVGSSVFMALWTTTTQRRIRADALARVNSYVTLGTFGLGPLGLALAGPVGLTIGIGSLFWVGAVWQVASTAVVLTLPSTRRLTLDQAPSTEATAVDGLPAEDDRASSR
ncbi:MFS transporter [Dactylosporangium sp. CA-139066]|uniref:MFS transporter n=1 Tax=Dactylosporangium sp. CA-139066 TaxID=3239930 RepID=UPI003D8A1036